MADQTSKIDDLFIDGSSFEVYDYLEYGVRLPLQRPHLLASRPQRLWSGIFTPLSFFSGLAGVVTLAVLAGVSDPHTAWWEILAGPWTAIAFACLDTNAKQIGARVSLLPRPGRWLARLWRRSCDETTQQLLEKIWLLREATGELASARKAFDVQRSGIDRERIAGFDEQARAALARGDREGARSLLTAKAEAEEHAAWLDAQVEAIDRQLEPLQSREFHLKTLIALRYFQRASLQTQTQANTTRAKIAAGGLREQLELDGPLDVSPQPLPQLREAALQAEARAAAEEELAGLRAATADQLGEAEVERALAELRTEVTIARTAN